MARFEMTAVSREGRPLKMTIDGDEKDLEILRQKEGITLILECSKEFE